MTAEGSAFFGIVFGVEPAHNFGMTTATRLGRFGSWMIRGAAAAVALAFCASAFADADKAQVPLAKEQQAKKTRKVFYVVTGTSAIPQPSERILCPIPTTTNPMQIIR